MYLKSFTAKNLKCFRDVTLTMPSEGGYAGWHVILGGNGVGKTTLLQGIALASLEQDAIRVLNGRNRFVRQGIGDEAAHLTAHTGPASQVYYVGLKDSANWGGESIFFDRHLPHRQKQLPDWFLVGYGPFRRFIGHEQNELVLPLRVARHQTLFNEGAALIRCEAWLKELYASSLDVKLGVTQVKAKADLSLVKHALNEMLKNQKVALHDISTQAVTFVRSGTDIEVQLHQLSDGYRSFLSLAVDLLGHIVDNDTFDVDDDGRIRCEGVVLIDEVDSHLHPRWQREIGERLCAVFPDLQFIVTTHSPFVAQSARPGGLFVLEAEDDAVVIKQPLDSVRGMRADQILTSPLFDLLSTRDLETERALQEREALMEKEALSPQERARLEVLERWLGQRMSTPGDTFEEYRYYKELEDELSDDLALMDET